MTLYHTKGGRPVFDGGGILPDVETEPMRLSDISFSLGTKMLLFDFATEFRHKNPTIAAATEFKVDDKLYSEFKEWLKDKEYDYTTESEELIKNLKKVAEEEKRFTPMQEEYEALEAKVSHNKTHDLENFSEELKDLLRAEIVSRYYFQKGRLQAMLDEDIDVAKAVSVLKDAPGYKKILTASK
jgi:carboxyl-terminal processing protease